MRQRGARGPGSLGGASLDVCGRETGTAEGVDLSGTREIGLCQRLIVGSRIACEDVHRVMETLVACGFYHRGQGHAHCCQVRVKVEGVGLVQDSVAEAVVSCLTTLEARRPMHRLICHEP